MKELEKIRFITANFTHLKGLQMGVIGLLVFSTALWSNRNHGDLTIFILLLILAAILSILVERFYRRVFGRVRTLQKSRQYETRHSLLFGASGLAAFIIDTAEILPFSLLGIVFGVGFWLDYYRINRDIEEKFFTFYPWFSLAMISLSILPALGVPIWDAMGFESAYLGVMAACGVLMIVIGVLAHLFLVRSLSPREEDILG